MYFIKKCFELYPFGRAYASRCFMGSKMQHSERRCKDLDELNTRKAKELDSLDALSCFRSRFSLPDGVYLCGHSLGPQPHAARKAVQAHLDKWANEGVAGHFAGNEAWSKMEDSASTLGCEIVGALPGEVVFMNSLTINLHLLLTAFYLPDIKSGRIEVLVEDHAFPSDDYAMQSHVKCRGIDPAHAIVRLSPRSGEHTLRDEDIVEEISVRAARGSLALVLFPGVQYYTGQVMPMSLIAKTCHKLGIPVGLDLAHAVGNVPLQMHEWNVDFAVWCTYKYLNCGPGAVGGAFIHSRHGDCAEMNRLGGWWGHDRQSRFAMGLEFHPQSGVYGFQVSNPSALALAPIAASLRVFSEAGGMEIFRQKSVSLTSYLHRRLLDTAPAHVNIVTPSEPDRRGCQLSVQLKGTNQPVGYIQKRLKDMGITCDVRDPDVLRVAPAPLYNSFSDVEQFVQALRNLLDEVKVTEHATGGTCR